MRFDESEIISACALRFDGYKYLEETGFDVDEALAYFFLTGGWNIRPIEQLAVFFILQRAFRQNLEYEPENGRYWRAFRQLFLEVCEFNVSEHYRHPTCYRRWEEKFEPYLSESVKLIGKIHKNMLYDDSASLSNRLLRKGARG